MIRTAISIFLFLGVLLSVNLYAEETSEEFKAAFAEASLFLKGGEYARAARRSTEAVFLTDNPEAEGWDEAVRLSLEAMEKWQASGKFPASPVCRLRVYRKYSMMLLLEDGAIANVYSVYTGPDFSVPPGRFTIGAKLPYPSLEKDGKVYSASAAENFLGARWMELITPDGICVSGIHGSKGDPSAEPRALYFTMDNKDIIRLYGLLREGTVVEVE